MGTKEQIIDAAERLFAESGFAGTSLRAVTREAEVNLAAVHYHFGSKEALFRAVVRQIAEPIVQQQVQRLDSLKELDSPPPVEKLIEAFVAPPLYIAQERREQYSESCSHAQFMSRCRMEPGPIQQIAEQEFSRSHERFLEISRKVFPDQSKIELEWKLDLIVAMIIRVLNQMKSVAISDQQDTSQEIEQIIQRLVKFITAGINV